MGRVKFTATFEDGESKSVTATIEDNILATAIIKPNNYDKSYGIDWCEMSDDLTKIVKFQETNVTDISHVLDETTTQFKNTPTAQDKQDILYKLYETEEYLSKQIPITWINLAKDETAVVNITIHLKEGLDINREDYITFEHDDTKFTIEHDNLQNSTIQLKRLDRARNNKKEYTEIKITALQTFATKEYILLKTVDGIEVGKIEMAPNDTVNLGVKIIPIVFKSTPAQEVLDARGLYESALNAGELEKTLNEKSLSQAGIECNIAALNRAVPECIVVDINQNNWLQFYVSNTFKNWDYQNTAAKPAVSLDEDGWKQYHSGDINPRFLIDKLEDSYYSKYGKTHKGALIFVTDKNFNIPNLQGLSQTDPIRSQGTVIFAKGLNVPSVYAHELAHILGLQHTFIKDINEFNSTNDKLNNLTRGRSIADKKQEIAETIVYQEDYISNFLMKEIEKVKLKNIEQIEKDSDIKDLEQQVLETKKGIVREKDKLNKLSITTTIANFKMTKEKTKNYMDYITNKTYFHKYQVEIIKEECVKFYN